jgi:hypothetical protein
VVTVLETSVEEWSLAVARRDIMKLHEIVNIWDSTIITPFEFLRLKKMGIRTGTSTIRQFKDESLIKKLNKVCFCLSIWFSFQF